MILKIFTREEGPESRAAKEIGGRVGDGFTVEYFDLDETESDPSVALYDIYSSPAILVTQDDGKLVEIWQGETPTESEIRNYLSL